MGDGAMAQFNTEIDLSWEGEYTRFIDPIGVTTYAGNDGHEYLPVESKQDVPW